jgi:hypothetical protein
MDFGFTSEQEAFRQEVRDFIKSETPEEFPCEGEDEGYGFGAWSFEYLRKIGEKGWVSLCWPTQYGGQNRPLVELFILFNELAYHWAPVEALFYTEAVCSAIIRYGCDSLKRDILPRAATGDVTFWEGFSEPEAGSDLLALTTKATRDGDCYIISGQKTWNSNAHRAHFGYTAARTDLQAPRHKGISMFLVDMKIPGITTRPIYAMYGGVPFAEVFFDEVCVTRERLVGEENGGFQQILDSLEWDRFWGRCVKASSCQRMLEEIIKYAKDVKHNGRPLVKNPLVRYRLAELAVEIDVCRVLFYEPLCKLNSGESLSYEAALAKTFADELGQRFTNAGMQILGLYGQLVETSKLAPLQGRLQRWYLCSPLFTLAGGTSEIQRNTIATRGLGLPRS